MVFKRFLNAVAGARRPETTVAMFRQAGRFRDAGRFEEAVALVERGLKADADNIVGHLMAGALHAVFRGMDRAKAEFERVLTLDPVPPPALLGLARVAMARDENDRPAQVLRPARSTTPSSRAPPKRRTSGPTAMRCSR